MCGYYKRPIKILDKEKQISCKICTIFYVRW